MLLKKSISIVLLFFPVCSFFFFAGDEINADQSTYGSKVTEDNSLLFDDHTPRFDKFPFDIEESKRLKPKANDFELVQYSPMSNKRGERWVLVTIRNTSSGQRFLKREYLVATFANGDQANPEIPDQKVDGGKTITKTIPFGVNKFPIVMLEVQP